jgi:hypothetical protein
MNLDLNPNDRSIIGAICHFPDMKVEEKQEMINKLQDRSLTRIVETLAGLKNMNELEPEERNQLVEIETWRDSKRTRIKNEQIDARRRSNQPNAFASKLLAMRSRGQISEEYLFLYGVSGDLPVSSTYAQMTLQEKKQIWEDRMVNKYGFSWRSYFNVLPSVFEDGCIDSALDNDEWVKEGF